MDSQTCRYCGGTIIFRKERHPPWRTYPIHVDGHCPGRSGWDGWQAARRTEHQFKSHDISDFPSWLACPNCKKQIRAAPCTGLALLFEEGPDQSIQPHECFKQVTVATVGIGTNEGNHQTPRRVEIPESFLNQHFGRVVSVRYLRHGSRGLLYLGVQRLDGRVVPLQYHHARFDEPPGFVDLGTPCHLNPEKPVLRLWDARRDFEHHDLHLENTNFYGIPGEVQNWIVVDVNARGQVPRWKQQRTAPRPAGMSGDRPIEERLQALSQSNRSEGEAAAEQSGRSGRGRGRGRGRRRGRRRRTTAARTPSPSPSPAPTAGPKAERNTTKEAKVACPTCGRKVKPTGLKDHIRAMHR